MPSESSTRHASRGAAGTTAVRGARLTLFGHDPTPARAEIVARSRRWRAMRAASVGGVGLLIVPLVALVPPHAPWALGAAVGGAFLARRRWRERHTLRKVEGACPRCGAELREAPEARLRHPHPLPCESCHHELSLVLDAGG